MSSEDSERTFERKFVEAELLGSGCGSRRIGIAFRQQIPDKIRNMLAILEKLE